MTLCTAQGCLDSPASGISTTQHLVRQLMHFSAYSHPDYPLPLSFLFFYLSLCLTLGGDFLVPFLSFPFFFFFTSLFFFAGHSLWARYCPPLLPCYDEPVYQYVSWSLLEPFLEPIFHLLDVCRSNPFGPATWLSRGLNQQTKHISQPCGLITPWFKSTRDPSGESTLALFRTPPWCKDLGLSLMDSTSQPVLLDGKGDNLCFFRAVLHDNIIVPMGEKGLTSVHPIDSQCTLAQTAYLFC